MSGYSVLARPLTPSEDVARRIMDIDQRLSGLERTVPVVTVDNSDPSGPAFAGAMHLNAAQGRFWIYTGGGWVTSSMGFTFGEDNSAYTAPAAGGAQYVGPSASILVADSGMVGVYAEADCSTGAGIGEAWIRDDLGNSWRWAQATQTGSCLHYTTAANAIGTGGNAGGDTGAYWPRGGFWVFATTPGQRTFTLGWQGDTAAVTYSGRRLYVAAF